MSETSGGLDVGGTLAGDEAVVPAELREALARGPVVLFFLRAFT